MSEKSRDIKATERRRPPMHGPMAGMMPAEKAKNFKGTAKRLLSFLRPQRFQIILVMILAVGSVIFTIASPKILGLATDKLFNGIVGKQITEQFTQYTGGEVPEWLDKDLLVGIMRVFGSDEVKEMVGSGGIDRQKLSQLLTENNAAPLAGMVVQATDEQLTQMINQLSERGNIGDMLEKMDFTPGAGIDFSGIAKIIMLLLAAYVLSALLTWMQHFIMGGVTQRTVYGMRKLIDAKLARMPLKYFDDTPRGEILSRVTNDVDNISQSLQQSITSIVTAFFTLIGVLIMMLTISPLLALVSLIILPLSGVTAMLIAKRSQKLYKAQWESTGKLNGQIEEMYTGHTVIKLFNRQSASMNTFGEENEKLYKASYKAQFMSGIVMPLMNVLGNVNFVLVCVIGGIRVAGGSLSLGDVQAFTQYSRQFTQPIMQTASIMNVLQSTMASAERVFELLDAPEQVLENDKAALPEHVAGSVEFDKVSFSYKPDAPLIEDMNLKVSPGQTVAIVGPTGAGKTTLVNLLMRFYETDEGAIKIDGTDTRDIRRDALRSTFGMVLQDTWLFGGTIRDNIAYGKKDATENEITEAARAAYADHFIKTLPDGYNTVLTDDATNISQGQRQLLTIARAFLSDPEILILDEATSSVDTRTESLIQKAMANLMKERTCFVIAHRLSTIRDADVILVMNNGSIIEQGRHDELMEKKGFYAELYNSQFTDMAI